MGRYVVNLRRRVTEHRVLTVVASTQHEARERAEAIALDKHKEWLPGEVDGPWDAETDNDGPVAVRVTEL